MHNWVAYLVFGGIFGIGMLQTFVNCAAHYGARKLPIEQRPNLYKVADVKFGVRMASVVVFGTLMTSALSVLWALNHWEVFLDGEPFLKIVIACGALTSMILYFVYLMVSTAVEDKITEAFLTPEQKDIFFAQRDKSKADAIKWHNKWFKKAA